MKLKKCLRIVCSVCIVACILFSTASAYEHPMDTSSAAQSISSTTDDTVQPMDLYSVFWRLKSCTKVGTVNRSYRNGPSGYGPATLTLSKSTTTTTSRTVENTITGEYTWGIKNISASTGHSFGKSEEQGISYSIKVPAGAHRMIIFRPVMRKYKIITEKVKMPTSGYGKTTILKTETAYGYIFDHWDYNWKNV